MADEAVLDDAIADSDSDSDSDDGIAAAGLAVEDERAQSMTKSGEGAEQKATADPRLGAQLGREMPSIAGTAKG